MALKTISAKTKAECVRRLLAGRTVADEARRLNVTPQAVRKWRQEYRAAHPEEIPAQPAAPAPAPVPDSTSPPAGGGHGPAMEAIGETPQLPPGPAAGSQPAGGSPPPSDSPPPPIQSTWSLQASAIEDELLVFMVGNQLMGWATRGGYLLAVRRRPLEEWPPFTKRLQDLCVLSDAEKAGLRPTVGTLAPMIRKFIGSNENVALGVAASVLVGGLAERLLAVRAEVKSGVRDVPPPAGGVQ